MTPESLEKLALTCFQHAEVSLSILERATTLESSAFPQETLLSSISFARRSEAIASLEHMTHEGIFSQFNDIYVCSLPKDKLKTIYLLVKGMTMIPRNAQKAAAEIVLTLPKPPNQLENAIRRFGPQAGMIQKTDEIFDHLAHQATRSLIVMTPFLDAAGSKLLLRLFSNARAEVEKKLILRFLSLGSEYAKYPSGYPPIREDLKAMGVKVYDYAIKRDSTTMLETFHAKTILSDDQMAYIGSSNFDQYSLENSMELGTLITGEPVKLVRCIIRSIISISTPINEMQRGGESNLNC